MKKLLAKADEELVQVNRLLRELRQRIASAAEVVQVAAEKAAKSGIHPGRKKGHAKSR